MTRRRHSSASVAVAAAAATATVIETIIVTEPLPVEELEDTTVEDYKALNEKMDGIITKIKVRKASKRKKL